jgi:hypothetical protein
MVDVLLLLASISFIKKKICVTFNKKMKKMLRRMVMAKNLWNIYPKYICHDLGEKWLFKQYYSGTFEKSFTTSHILSEGKFMVDLSVLRHDGGGTQYTFLEAIHNDTVLIINRKWIENVNSKYCDFKEGYNCYAVSNGQDLAEIINKSNNI